MDLLAALRTNQLEQFKQTFTWKTKEGRTVRLGDMDTTHLFNTAKLLLNKFSEAQIQTLYRRGANSYACQSKNGQTIFFMVWEIENRDDLQPRYRVAYQQMITRIFDNQFIFQDLPPAIVRQRPGAPAASPRVPPLQEFAQTFMGVDYGEMERRVLGRFASSEPQRQSIPREEMDLGTIAFTQDHMLDMIRRGSMRGQLDLTLWMLTVPDCFREGATWAADHVGRRLIGRTMNDRSLHEFVAAFQSLKGSALVAGDLTRTGWVTPAAYRTDAERELRAREDERRGRGRQRAIDYLAMMRNSMGPDQFERRMVPMLERIEGNRPLLDEFRYLISQEDRNRRMAEITAGRSELRGRNPLLMVFDEPTYMGNLGRPPEPAQTKKEEPKIDPVQQVEQLTQIGKRKMNLGEANDDET